MTGSSPTGVATTRRILIVIPWADAAFHTAHSLLVWVAAAAEAEAVAACDALLEKDPATVLRMTRAVDRASATDGLEANGIWIGHPVAIPGLVPDGVDELPTGLPAVGSSDPEPEVQLECAACQRDMKLDSRGSVSDGICGHRMAVFDVPVAKDGKRALLCCTCAYNSKRIAEAGLQLDVDLLGEALEVWLREPHSKAEDADRLQQLEDERFLRVYTRLGGQAPTMGSPAGRCTI